MSFVNPAVLTALALITIPVLLHMLMRARPKKVVFPALRLIQARRRSSSRRLRLRHLLLLLLRIATLGLFILALARPSLPPARYTPSLGEAATATIVSLLAIGGYLLAMNRWQRRQLPAHELRYRRTMGRAVAGGSWLLLMLAVVAWPYQKRIAAEIAEPLPEVAESLPVAAVFLFDTSSSMAYQLENETRLDVARRIAAEHLARLPRQSRVAVMSTSELNEAPLVADLSAAQSRIENLQLNDAVIPFDDCLETAVEMLESQYQDGDSPDGSTTAQYLYEVYVFTDMARSAWPPRANDRLSDKLDEARWLQTYLIDTGIENPTNLGIARVRLSNQQPPVTSELIVTTELIGRSGAAGGSIELLMPDASGKLVKRDQRLVPAADQSAPGDRLEVQFFVRNLKPGLNQAEIRLSGNDPLAIDNQAYFTVDVGDPIRILVLADRQSDASLWINALAPEELIRLDRAPYEVRYQAPASAANTRLAAFDLVCLIDVQRPTQAMWTALYDYVRDGGALFTTLGTSQLDIKSYLNPTARQLLPAEPLGEVRFREPEFLDVPNTTIHQMFAVYDELGGVGELTAAEIRRCWSVQPVEGARVICRYTNLDGFPALVERTVGDGRSLVLTTALRADDWSDLVRSRWSYLALADQIAQYLTARAENQLNFVAGMPVAVSVDSADRDRGYRLRKPGFEQTRGEIGAHQSVVRIDDCRKAGHYQLMVGQGDDVDLVGFSTNRPDKESDLTRIDTEELNEFLGEDNYTISADLDQLDRTVRQLRLGQEVYPWLISLLVLLFCGEHLVANRFYDEPGSTADSDAADSSAANPSTPSPQASVTA